MIKRMTLLSRKEGTAISDFRAYWAGCHARLALCMDGITSYTQNRVEKTLWQHADSEGCFQVDGVVELCFESDEVMSVAQSSAVGSRYIPEDEPNFLRGWSLCVVEQDDKHNDPIGVKVLIAAALKSSADRETFREALNAANAAQSRPARMSFNWTSRTARRERLWSEPVSPSVLAAMWFDNIAQAHAAFEADGAFHQAIYSMSTRAAAYLIDPLVVK
ncbi:MULTISPECIES: EthD domain-containing protein [Burkholderia]|uniref:EthD domain-containing protein n=1 Tax=Burkholderia TaxID=32008 RepID=UPI00103FBD27|nr:MULTISPECIES: EthD domain-containing protein [Burkholderia]